MIHSPHETLDLHRPDLSFARRDEGATELTPQLVRIVRRALRRPDDHSPLACAVRQAAAQVETEPGLRLSFDEDIRIRQVVRRMSAILTPEHRDPLRREAHRETVCV